MTITNVLVWVRVVQRGKRNHRPSYVAHGFPESQLQKAVGRVCAKERA